MAEDIYQLVVENHFVRSKHHLARSPTPPIVRYRAPRHFPVVVSQGFEGHVGNCIGPRVIDTLRKFLPKTAYLRESVACVMAVIGGLPQRRSELSDAVFDRSATAINGGAIACDRRAKGHAGRTVTDPHVVIQEAEGLAGFERLKPEGYPAQLDRHGVEVDTVEAGSDDVSESGSHLVRCRLSFTGAHGCHCPSDPVSRSEIGRAHV